MPDDPGSDTSSEKLGAPGAKPRAPADTVVQHGPPSIAHDPAAPAPPGYELLAEVGRGGMGVVYRARDLALGRDVAVKLLQDRYPPDGPAARQFIEEAQITGQLVHPGVPPIHQVGRLSDGRPFLVMKLIKGHTLDVLLAGGAEKVERAGLLAIFESLCGTVGYAHERGVIHRDLKPSNVMVGAFGEVQVMDWGLAKVLRDGEARAASAETDDERTVPRAAHSELRVPHSDETLAGSVMGTPGYMSPEQAGGELAKIDRRTDVFALGGILCAILTGRGPYTGETPTEVHLKAVRCQTADALGALAACGAEPELVALCERCLSADPDKRPKDAGEVAKAVADFRRATGERARSAELEQVRAETEKEAVRRSQSQVVSAVAKENAPAPRVSRRAVLFGAPVVAAAAVGAYFAFRKRGGPPPDDGPAPLPAPPAVLVPKRDVEGDVAAVALSDDGRWLAVALGDWDPPLKVGGVKLFDRSKGAAPELWWKWKDAACRGVALSPDGKLLAVAAGDALRVVNLADGQEVAFPDATIPGAARAVAFSPDGKFLALAVDQADAPDRTPRPGLTRVWEVATRANARDFARPNLPIRSVAFAPDSTVLAAGMSTRANKLESSVEVWKVAGGHSRTIDLQLAVAGPYISFARNAPLCAVSDQTGVNLYQIPSFALEHEFSTLGAGEPTAVALGPDGAVLAFALGGLIHLGNVSTDLSYAVLEKHEKDISALAFTSDGKALVSGSHDATVREWTVPAPK